MSNARSAFRRPLRWALSALAAVLALLLIAALVAHAPFVRRAVLAEVVARLATMGLRLEARDLSYDLVTLSARLDDVTLAGRDPATPFLHADAARVDLPWSVIRGSLAIQSIEIDRPRLTIVRDAAGATNLPSFTTTAASGALAPVAIDRLLIRDLAATFTDASSGTSIAASGVTLDMRRGVAGPLTGTLSMARPATMQIADRATRIDSLQGRLAFDGRTLTLGTLDLQSPEVHAHVEGRADLLAAAPRAALRYRAQADVQRAAPWLGIAAATPTGTLTVSGSVDGPFGELTAQADLASDHLEWPGLGAVAVTGRGVFAGSTVRLDALHASLAGGEISADGSVQIHDAGGSSARATWRNLDVARLARIASALPVRIAGSTSGEVALEWRRLELADVSGHVGATFVSSAAPSDALPLNGRITLDARGGRWTLGLDQEFSGVGAVAGVLNGGLGRDTSDTTLAGQVRIDVPDARAALIQVAAAGYPAMDADVVQRIRGAASADLSLAGTIQSPRASGTLQIAQAWFEQTGPASATAVFSATTSRVVISQLQAAIESNVVQGQGAIALATGGLTGSVTGQLPEVGRLIGSMAPGVQGAARFEAGLGGTVTNPALDVRAEMRDVQVAGQSATLLVSRARLVNHVLVVDELTIDQSGGGRLSLTGQYELSRKQYVLDANGRDLVVAPVPSVQTASSGAAPAAAPVLLPIDARVGLQLHGTGSVASPQLAGVVDLAGLTWGRYQVGDAHADIDIAAGRASAQVQLPSVHATASASYTVESKAFDLDASLAGADLSALVRASGPAGPQSDDVAIRDVRGTVTLHARGNGRLDDLETATADVELSLADAAVGGLNVRADRPVHLRYADRQFVADDVVLGVGTSTLSVSGRIGATQSSAEGWHASLRGSLSDFMPLIQMRTTTSAPKASGTIDLDLRAAGTLRAPEISGTLAVSGASFSSGGGNAWPGVSGVTLQASYGRGVLEVHTARAEWQGAVVTASGQLPIGVLGRDALPSFLRAGLPPSAPAPARADLRIESVTPTALTPLLSPETVSRLGGRIDLSASVVADALDLTHVTADVTLDRAELALAEVPIAQTAPTRLRLANGQLDVVQWSWAGAGNRLDVNGHVSLTDPAAALNLAVSGSLDLRMIGAFAPLVAASGRAALDMTATGALAAPEFAGELSVANADVVSRSPRIGLTDLHGTATFDQRQITLRDVGASANGGTFQADGTLEYKGLSITGGALAMHARGLAIEVPANLRTEVDADLTLGAERGQPSITGRITVQRGAYREPISLAEFLLAGTTTLPDATLETAAGPFNNVELGIALVTENDLLVDNNYGRLDVGANLRLTGTVGRPGMAGRLTVREGGQVFLGGRVYEVQRGNVDFTNPSRIEPNVDIALGTRVQDYDITLEITGTPETLEVALRSPGQSQEDIVSLLLTGQLARDTAVVSTDVARGQLLMLLSGELLGFAGRAVGLDSAQVSRGLGAAASDFDLLGTESDPSARLTVSRHLSRAAEIIVSQSLRESGDITWIVSYRPVRAVTLRATTNDDGSRAYEYRQQLVFGGPAGAARAEPAAQRAPAPRVSEVRFTDAPASDEHGLRALLRVGPGDRFNFFRWQQDRDRLAGWYQERGFLEARITARREERTDGTTQSEVALEYRVERGPLAKLTVEGYALPGDVVARMRAAWENAVFDGFLLEDLQTIARDALVRGGRLQARATAAVSSSGPDEKEIVVHVEPGPEFAERRLTFSGNVHVTNAELAGAVDAAGLSVNAWTTPASLKQALERYYRSRGFLSAIVTPQPPAFAGDSASLPVRIAEGEPFRIGEVHVRGMAALSEDAARGFVGLTSGDLYLPSAVEPARRRLESEYLRRAYNDVRVSAATEVERDAARVDVTLSVDEGPRQVVSGVEVAGADVTKRDVVDRALKLKAGDPADLNEIYRGQKRLYDTGVFQTADITLQPAAADESAAQTTEPVRAVVALQEVAPYRFRYGFRLNDEVAPVDATRQVQPGFVADLLRRNLFGRAWSAGVSGQIEPDLRLSRAYLSAPTFFGRPVVTNVFATVSRQFFPPAEEFDLSLVERVNEITLEQRFRPARHMAVSYGYSFSKEHNFETNHDPESVLPAHDVSTNIARLTSAYAWDTRDDPSNAHRGWFHSSGLEFGSLALGSDLRFVKYLAQEYYFRPVGRQVVLASALRLGLGRGFGDQDLIDKFRAGGGTTVRGFAEDSLGPSDFFGPLGGNAMLVLNQEVRFPIYKWLRGASFLDAGNVFPQARDLSLSQLAAGTGVGLRFESPFVLLRVDFGVPLTDRANQPSARWYFGIGHTF